MTVKELLKGGKYVTIYSKGRKTLTITEVNKNRYWTTKLVEKCQGSQFNVTRGSFDCSLELDNYIQEVMNAD